MGVQGNSLSYPLSPRILEDRLLSMVLDRRRSVRYPEAHYPLQGAPLPPPPPPQPDPSAWLCVTATKASTRCRLHQGAEGRGRKSASGLSQTRSPSDRLRPVRSPPGSLWRPGTGDRSSNSRYSPNWERAHRSITSEPLRNLVQSGRKSSPAQIWPCEPHHVGGGPPQTEMAGSRSVYPAPKSQPWRRFPGNTG